MATNFLTLTHASTCHVRRFTARCSSDETPPPRPTKVLLPKKKPLKWSDGMAPGEYGGPPTTSGLRKYWGGNNEDPVTAMDDFIWNKDFEPRMRRLLNNEPSEIESFKFKEEPSSGFLNLTRAMSLNNLEIDLSKELQPPSKPVLQYQVEAARRGIPVAEKSDGPKWRLAPTSKEQDKWDRAANFATGGTDVILRESRRKRGDPKVLAAKSMEQYNNLKQKMLTVTLGIGGVGLVSAYFSYSPEIAASFGVGLAGSLLYIRMLGRTVDSMANSSGGLMRGAAGQPRLLVPIALVMIFNRWNAILAPEYGLMHLELIPMLVGFFTYKAATFIQAIEAAIEKPESESLL